MRADDLELSELVDIKEGNLSLHGRRLVLHSTHALGQFRKDILETLGWESTRRLFTRFGFFWGQADAAAMKRIFKWDSLTEWLRAGVRLLALEGYTRSSIREMVLDEANGRLRMEMVWNDSGEAEGHLAEIGRAEDPICWKLIGYASGYASFCMGKSIYFIEKKCLGSGNNFCLVSGRDLESWGDEIKPHLKYFEAEDIKGSVEKLTLELRKKTEELSRHQERLAILDIRSQPFFAKVRSKSMQLILDLAQRVAKFDTSVLITGETGVGKEVLAHFIHNISHRSKGNFVAINCGALPETLLESELFGHKAGAFTGAIQNRIGLFEQAAKGTVFLDEIGDISPAMQLKILRVLQEKEIMRVGESKPRKVDTRVLAATNRNLEKEVADGNFREDLLYRLRVIEIEVPPLRGRKEDILPLARYFVNQLAKKLELPGLHLDATCVDYLQNYFWPGNVRELENAIERAAVLSPDGAIRSEYLPAQILEGVSAGRASVNPLTHTLEEVEREHIQAVLKSTNGNRTHAAKVLGISLSTLWRKLKESE